jgi:outer membrane protein assembly factor BamB
MIDLPTTMACAACATLVLAAPAAGQDAPVQDVPVKDAPVKARPDTIAAPAAKAKPDADSRAAAMAALDARYVVGPATADDFGYRIVWQTEPLATRDAHLEVMNATADSAWFGDSAGSIVRIRRDNGETVWRSSTYQGTDRMLSLDYLPSERHDNVYVVTELASVALDATTGSLIRKTRFAQLPACAPAVFGPTMIFGTNTGLASWFQYSSGYNWRSTTLGGHVTAPVTITGELALAGSTNGTVMAMEAASAGIRWTRKLSAGVEAPIAADNQACFVASMDQSLWAFDLSNGRVLWQYFTQAALTNPPVRIADGLFLQIPGEGLVSFNPMPNEKPEGEVRWKSKAPGNVIARVGTNLMAWDAASHTLSSVAVSNGRIVTQVSMPKVESIKFVPNIDGDMFLASHEGTVERLETLARSAGNAGMTAASKDKAMDKASASPQGKSAPSADDGAAPAPGDGNANSTRTRN